MVSFTSLFIPSATPAEIVLFARNQLSKRDRCDQKDRATFFVGSIRLRITQAQAAIGGLPAGNPARDNQARAGE